MRAKINSPRLSELPRLSSTMGRWRMLAAYLFIVLLTRQLVGGAWTFSLRVSARCCTDIPSCEQVDSCEALSIGICIRNPDTPPEFLESCSIFFLGIGSEIVGRQLTPSDGFNTNNPGDITTTGYQGGVQIFAGITTMPELAPFDNGPIDTIFLPVEISPGGEVLVTGVGKNQRVNLTFFISVECVPGYSGDDCLTVNTCMAPQCTTTEPPTSSSGSGSDPAPIIAGVVVAIVVLAIIVIIIVAVIILLCYKKKKKEQKRAEEIVLTGSLDNSPASTIQPPSTPLYSTIKIKEQKRRRTPPEIPAPYQVPVAESDLETSATHPSHQATESNGEEPMTNGTAGKGGLVYAELDIHTKNRKNAPPKPPRPPDISCPQPGDEGDEEQPVTYSTINKNPYSTPRTPSQPANPGEVTYYTTVTSTN